MEVSVKNYLMIRCIIRIGIYISLIAAQFCTLYGEGCSIKYMYLTCNQICLSCINCFLSSFCYMQNPSSVSSTEPVSRVPAQSVSIAVPVCYTVDGIFKVRLPVDLWKIQGRCSGMHLRCFRCRIHSVHLLSHMR